MLLFSATGKLLMGAGCTEKYDLVCGVFWAALRDSKGTVSMGATGAMAPVDLRTGLLAPVDLSKNA